MEDPLTYRAKWVVPTLTEMGTFAIRGKGGSPATQTLVTEE